MIAQAREGELASLPAALGLASTQPMNALKGDAVKDFLGHDYRLFGISACRQCHSQCKYFKRPQKKSLTALTLTLPSPPGTGARG